MMETLKTNLTNIIISLIASFVFMVLGGVIATATGNLGGVKVFVIVARNIGIAISVLNAFLFIYWSFILYKNM